MLRAPFLKGQQKSLAYTCIKQLDNWLESGCRAERRTELQQLLSPQIKHLAFTLANRGLPHFLTLVARVFQLAASPDNQMFVPIIEPLLEQKKFKEAAQCISATALQASFDCERVLFPLIAQNKLTTVEAYTRDCVEAQRALLRLLDGFCEFNGRNAVRTAVQMELPDIQLEHLSKRSLCKLTQRLLKRYGLESEKLCPNVVQVRDTGGMNNLLYKCFISHKVSLTAFRELMLAELRSDANLYHHLVKQLLEFREVREARYWAEKEFGWSETEMPAELVG